ncbi:MAG TPA: polysaccharide biosynthesis C-terminal domain-containing protein, partial [Thermotogota bacterium]|nr:polysaccharide biosynthesis C-terminal domain-containing protein [Thermotogota bacterium]
NVILDFTLAPIQGAYGVALATSFAGMTPVAFLLVHLIRIKGLTMTRRQLSELLKTVSATAVMSAVLLMIAKTYSYSKPLVVLELVCGVLVYLLALLLLRKQEMKRLILRWSRRG